MKIHPGKARLESILLGMHPPGPLRSAVVHENGETATVQIADKYFRYRLKEPAKEILQGRAAVWRRDSDLVELI